MCSEPDAKGGTKCAKSLSNSFAGTTVKISNYKIDMIDSNKLRDPFTRSRNPKINIKDPNKVFKPEGLIKNSKQSI